MTVVLIFINSKFLTWNESNWEIKTYNLLLIFPTLAEKVSNPQEHTVHIYKYGWKIWMKKETPSMKLPPPSSKRVVDHNVVTLVSSHCIILLRYILEFNVSNNKRQHFYENWESYIIHRYYCQTKSFETWYLSNVFQDQSNKRKHL